VPRDARLDLLACGAQARADRVEIDLEDLGDLWIGSLLEPSEDEDCAFLGTETVEELLEEAHAFACHGGLFGASFFRIRERIDELTLRRARRETPHRSVMPEDDPDEDREEPSAHRVPRLVSRQDLVNDEENLLYDVVNLAQAHAEPTRASPDEVEVRLVHLVEARPCRDTYRFLGRIEALRCREA